MTSGGAGAFTSSFSKRVCVLRTMVTFHVASSNAKIHAQRVLIPLESMQQLALATGDRVLVKHADSPDKVFSS